MLLEATLFVAISSGRGGESMYMESFVHFALIQCRIMSMYMLTQQSRVSNTGSESNLTCTQALALAQEKDNLPLVNSAMRFGTCLTAAIETEIL